MGCDQRDQVAAFGAHRRVVAGEFLVELQGGPHRQRAGAFGVGARGQQHLAHVGVDDDRIGRTVRRLDARQRAHLDPVLGIRDRVLVGHLGQPQRLHADAEAGRVHHHEHGGQALVRLTHQRADRAVEVDLGGGVAVDAHLVLEAAAIDRVAGTERAVGVDQELRHHEQRDALGAGRRVRQPSQHQVDDVLGQIVFTGRDEDLVAGELVGAVALRFGPGAQHAEVGAAVRFGQAHGAGPVAAGELGQVGLLLRIGTVRMQRLVGAVRQARVHGPGLVGRVEHLVHALVDQVRQALAAVGGVAAQRRPAAFDELGIGGLETGRCPDLVGGAVEHAAFLVTALVQGRDHGGRELATLLDHRVDGVDVDVGVGRQGPEFGDDV